MLYPLPMRQVAFDLLLDLRQLFFAHGVDLPYAEHCIAYCKLFEILEADLFRGALYIIYGKANMESRKYALSAAGGHGEHGG